MLELQPTKPDNRRRGLFPLSVVIPPEISSGTGWSFLDRSHPGFCELAVQKWLAVCSAQLNSYYGVGYAVAGALTGKVHNAAEGKCGNVRLSMTLRKRQKKRELFFLVKRFQCHILWVFTDRQVCRRLGHGASVPLLPFVTGRTRFLLENPLESLGGRGPCRRALSG